MIGRISERLVLCLKKYLSSSVMSTWLYGIKRLISFGLNMLEDYISVLENQNS